MTTHPGADVNVLDPDLYAAASPEDNGMPLAAYEWLRDHDPVSRQTFSDPLFVEATWIVSRHEDAVWVLRHPDVFTSARGTTVRRLHPTLPEEGGKPAMITLEGTAHHRNRRIVQRAFTPAVVRTFERHFRSLAAGILDRAVGRREVDFVAEVAAPLPLFAICDLLGVPAEDRSRLLGWTNTFTIPTDPDYAPGMDEVHAAIAAIWDYGLELAARRRAEPGTDLMSMMVAARDSEQLTDDELMGFMLTLTAAGNETTRNTIAHSLLALLQRPEALEWLRDRREGIPASAVEELLRWSSPVIHSRRTATRPIELHGRRIEPGDALVILYPAANFDPRRFGDPLRLDLERNPNPHLTFATGAHLCLGAHVARLEVKILFEELLGRTASIELVGPCTYARDNAIRGVKQLPVRLSGG